MVASARIVDLRGALGVAELLRRALDREAIGQDGERYSWHLLS